MKPFKILANFLTEFLSSNVQERCNSLCDFQRIRREIKPGDVLLIEGRSRVSQVIKQITQSPWSHAILYIGRIHDIEDKKIQKIISKTYTGSSDEQLIIESELGIGTAIQSLKKYQGEHVRICRPRDLSFDDSQKVIQYAISRLGMDYNIRQILDLARFFFPYTLIPRRLGSSLFQHAPGQETKTVCSSMIAEAFSFIHFPILPLVKHNDDSGIQLFQQNPKLCTPRDFDYSPYFQIIKYPFLDYNHHANYRLLPWYGQGVLEGNEADFYLSSEQIKELQEDNSVELKTNEVKDTSEEIEQNKNHLLVNKKNKDNGNSLSIH